MPARPWTGDREGVLPPKLEDWVATDHPVRFVAAFVAELSEARPSGPRSGLVPVATPGVPRPTIRWSCSGSGSTGS